MARTEVRGGQILDASVSLTADVTGTLPVANGGTGAATQSANSVLLGNGTGALQNVAPSTARNVLESNGTTWASVPSGGRFAGEITAYAGFASPTGWLRCTGVAYSRTTYADLFAALVPSLGTVTITIASPGAITTSPAHGLVNGDAIYLTTTGALPTGYSANTIYYVNLSSSTVVRLAATRINAISGTGLINTSGTQSGVHTLRHCPYGLGDGSTTFNIPDLRGRVIAGPDDMNAGAAGRLTSYNTTGSYGNLGASGGAEKHVIDTSEMPAHVHSIPTTRGGVNWTGGSAQGSDPSLGFGTNSGSTGSGIAHNNTQPTLVMNYIIKT